MNSFEEFLKEEKIEELKSLHDFVKTGKRFTAGGKTKKKVLIFDIDDTLLTGEVYILIRDKKTGRYLHKVNSNVFNTYKLKPGETFDFSEFSDPDIFNKNKVTKYFDVMLHQYKKGVHICLLTARGGKDVGDMIRKYFLKKGIDIKEELVICVNDDDSPYTGTTAEKKSQAIEDIYKAGYRTMVFFDDNKENLEQAEEIAKKLPINMVTIHADIHSKENEPYIR